MRVAPCVIAIVLCLSQIGCSLFGKKTPDSARSPAGGSDSTFGPRGDPTPGAGAFDRAPTPARHNGMLAGQVIDHDNRRVAQAFVQIAESSDANAAPIEKPTDNQGYFTIEGLQAGRRYLLTARHRNGAQEWSGRAWATAPDARVVIRLNDAAAAPAVQPFPPVNANDPLQGGSDTSRNGSGNSGPRRPAELGPPTRTNPGAQNPTPSVPAPPEQPRAEVRPDRVAESELARNEPPKAEIPTWGAPARPAPQPAAPVVEASTAPAFGPARVPSCVLTGDTLHNFALNDLNGNAWEFRQHRGRLVLLDFWGTWCVYCLGSIPHLNILNERYGSQGLEVVGIAYEEGTHREQVQKVNRVRQRLNMQYRVLLGGDAHQPPCPVKTQFGVTHWPTLVLLDDRGKILWRGEGLGAQQLRELEVIIRQRLAVR